MLEILYDNGPCLVINKPSGILTQAPAGIDSLEVQVKAFYREREQKEGNIYLGLPHRLDRPVSGAIVFARHVRAAQRLIDPVREPHGDEGLLGGRRGRCARRTKGLGPTTCTSGMGCRRSIVVPADDPRGKIAIMRYRGSAWLDGGIARERRAQWLKSNSKRGARTRFACSAARAAMRSSAMRSTVRRIRSASSSRMSGCGRLRFMHGNSVQSPDDERAGGCDCADATGVGAFDLPRPE